jgi:hypothetical protein
MFLTPHHGQRSISPEKGTRWGLIIGLVAGGLVVLCCAGGALFLKSSASQSEPASSAAETYVNAVIAGDDVTAQRYVCSTPDSKESHQDFTDYVSTKGVIDSRLTTTHVSIWKLSWKATVHLELTADTGATETMKLPLANEDGTWKVCFV